MSNASPTNLKETSYPLHAPQAPRDSNPGNGGCVPTAISHPALPAGGIVAGGLLIATRPVNGADTAERDKVTPTFYLWIDIFRH